MTTISERARENARGMSNNEIMKIALGLFNSVQRNIAEGDYQDAQDAAIEANAYFFAISRVHASEVEAYEAVRAVHNQVHVIMSDLYKQGKVS